MLSADFFPSMLKIYLLVPRGFFYSGSWTASDLVLLCLPEYRYILWDIRCYHIQSNYMYQPDLWENLWGTRGTLEKKKKKKRSSKVLLNDDYAIFLCVFF